MQEQDVLKEIQKHISTVLVRLRNDKFLSQKEAAKRAGIGLTTYKHMERCTRIPSLKAYIKVSDGFGISIYNLFSMTQGEHDAQIIKDRQESWITGR